MEIEKCLTQSKAFDWLLKNQNKTLEYNYKTYTVLEYFARVEEMTIQNILDLEILIDGALK